MKDLSNIQPQVIELMDKLLAENKAIPHRAAGLGIAKDYNGENMSTPICAAFMTRNPRTNAGNEERWETLVTAWFYLSLTKGMVNKDDDKAFFNTFADLCLQYAYRHC